MPRNARLKNAPSDQPIPLIGRNPFHEAVPMSEKLAHKAKIYAVGIVVFIAAFGFLTVLSIFVAHLK
jgi:hypothetical protein